MSVSKAKLANIYQEGKKFAWKIADSLCVLLVIITVYDVITEKGVRTTKWLPDIPSPIQQTAQYVI
jgi:hypothetical protein